MFDKSRALGLLGSAATSLAEAQEQLDKIRKEDGDLSNLKQKRNAVRRPLEDVEQALSDLRGLVASADVTPVATDTDTSDAGTVDAGGETPDAGGETPDAGGTETPGAGATDTPTGDTGTSDPVGAGESPPPDDLFSIEDQHAVSKLMQDSAVHLATIRKRDFWEIRHRNTSDGRPSEPIRAGTIAAAYSIYEQQAVRKGGFVPPEPRALTPAEQQALADFRNMPVDNPRSVRWEATMTEVDYIDKNRHHAGGKSDDVQFPPGELIGPVEHLKTVLS